MTEETHANFLARIEKLRTEAEAKGFESFELTDKERAVIENLPPEALETMESVLGKYTPTGPDVRREMLEKLIAVYLLEIQPIVIESMREGYKFGPETT